MSCLRRVTSIAAICLATSVFASPLRPAGADSASVLPTGEALVDSLLVQVEFLELELRKQDYRLEAVQREADWWQEKAEDLEPSTFEMVVRDPRLWFIVGVSLGALVVR
jgi:hypothetical protein